jgi:ubiquitin-like protein Pup
MTEREFRSASNAQSDEVAEVILPTAAASSIDVSDILDEIDLVLEANAEEFVKSFVQKGGQ